MRSLLFIILSVAFYLPLSGQTLTEVYTQWSDDFREWVVVADDGEEEGSLEMRWQIRNDWTEWDYTLGEHDGTIKMKWGDNPNIWEIYADGELIEVQTRWRNDFRQWRIKSRDHQILFKSRWSNVLNEWEIVGDNDGYFAIYMRWEGDPREWEIIDELDPNVSFGVKAAMVFLAIFFNIP